MLLWVLRSPIPLPILAVSAAADGIAAVITFRRYVLELSAASTLAREYLVQRYGPEFRMPRGRMSWPLHLRKELERLGIPQEAWPAATMDVADAIGPQTASACRKEGLVILPFSLCAGFALTLLPLAATSSSSTGRVVFGAIGSATALGFALLFLQLRALIRRAGKTAAKELTEKYGRQFEPPVWKWRSSWVDYLRSELQRLDVPTESWPVRLRNEPR